MRDKRNPIYAQSRQITKKRIYILGRGGGEGKGKAYIYILRDFPEIKDLNL